VIDGKERILGAAPWRGCIVAKEMPEPVSGKQTAPRFQGLVETED
jgi:hypothetical protein